MPYQIYKSDGTSIVIPDDNVDQVFYNPIGGGGYGPGDVPQSGNGLGVQLIGRKTINFGAAVAQNFLQLQENFCSFAVPLDSTSLQGQLWFNQTSTTAGNLYVRTTTNTSGGLANWKQVILATSSGDLTVTGNLTVEGTNSTFVNFSATGNGVIDGILTVDGSINGNGAGLTGTASGLNIGGNAATATLATTAITSNNLFAGAAHEIPVQTAPGTTGFITAPSVSGTFLKWNGSTFVWATPAVVAVTSVTASGAGITASPTTGAVVISNTGVTSIIAGSNIMVSGATGAITISSTSTTGVASFNGRTGAVSFLNSDLTSVMTAADIDSALGYTPYSAANPAGYISNAVITFNGRNGAVTLTSSDVTTALGSVVTTVTGTANQITASPTSGAVVLSLPSPMTTPGNLSVSGSITATGDVTAFFSDRRLKIVLENIPNALDAVCSLNGVIFVNNSLANKFGYNETKEQVGVIAQEVEAVLPQVVTLAPFDTEIDSNGNKISKSGENYKTIHYEKLVPLLIEAIKELRAEIECLKGNKPGDK
jgi:hypothetical protein